MELRLSIPVLLDAPWVTTPVDLDRAVWKRSFALRGPIALPLNVGDTP